MQVTPIGGKWRENLMILIQCVFVYDKNSNNLVWGIIQGD